MDRFSQEVRTLRSERERVREQLFSAIIAELPQGAGMFPRDSNKVSHELIDALTYIFLTSSRTATLPESTLHTLRAWALDLRRYGFPPTAYAVFARLIRQVLSAGIEARFVLEDAAAEMARTAHAADVEGVPAAAAARVTAVRPEGGIHVVRLEAGFPLGYRPGQFMPVLQVGRQGVWRNLAPALPANPFCQLEFHVTCEIEVQVGDYVTLGAARGMWPSFARSELSVTAVGSGTAAAKAIVFHALEMPQPPRVRLALLGEVAQRSTFERLAAVCEWFSIVETPSTSGEVVYCGPEVDIAALNPPPGVLRVCPDAPEKWSVPAS